MNFKDYINEEASKDQINHWAKYARKMTFNSEEDARNWIFHKLEKADKEFGDVFGKKGEEENKKLANEIPIYQSGKSYKIGKRIRKDNRLRLSQLTIKKPDIEELSLIAQSNGTSQYKFLPVKNVKIDDIVDVDAFNYQNSGEQFRIRNLAQKIKENGWIEPVVYHANEGWLIEGQHRARAIKLLGFQTIPAIGIYYLDD